MPASDAVTPAQLQFALLLLARQQGGEPTVARAATDELKRWRSADETHERAYIKALAAWNGTAANVLQDAVALPYAQASRKRQAVRRGLVLTLGLASFAFTQRWLPRRADSPRVMTTAQREIRTVRLADGTRVDIGAMTTLRLMESKGVRQLFLAAGDARLSVTKDANRPFVVATMFGRVTVVGTEFSVSVMPMSMQVAVSEGKVVVRADEQAILSGVAPTATMASSAMSDAVVLTQGDAVAVDADGLHPVTQVLPATVGAWREGWLVFDREDLLTAITRWNRYAEDVVRVRPRDAHALRSLRITGSFTIADEAAFLESLPKILPVKVTRQAGLAWLTRR